MHDFLIFSPRHGFWSTNLGWIRYPEFADRFPSVGAAREYLPPTTTGSASVVPADLYTHWDEETLWQAMIRQLENIGPRAVAAFCKVLDIPCSEVLPGLTGEQIAVDLEGHLWEGLKELPPRVLELVAKREFNLVVRHDGQQGYYVMRKAIEK